MAGYVEFVCAQGTLRYPPWMFVSSSKGTESCEEYMFSC